MGPIRAVKAWALFSLLISLGSGGSLSYAQTNTFPSDGNVGIETTGPLSKLAIGGGGTADADLYIGNGAQDAAIYIDGGANGVGSKITLQGRDTVVRTTVLKHDAAGLFTIDNSGTAGTEFAITGGNVGIGTTNPTSKFHVAGDARITGDLTTDGNIAAKYQDVAEWVRAGSALQPGTVVVINPAKDDQVLPASAPYDTRVAGVVSAQPGIILGEGGADKAKVAHSGRVKVRVDAQYGSVAAGDLLVSSPTAGYAMISRPIDLNGISIHRPGTIVGKALEPLKEGRGEILVLLTLQ